MEYGLPLVQNKKYDATEVRGSPSHQQVLAAGGQHLPHGGPHTGDGQTHGGVDRHLYDLLGGAGSVVCRYGEEHPTQSHHPLHTQDDPAHDPGQGDDGDGGVGAGDQQVDGALVHDAQHPHHRGQHEEAVQQGGGQVEEQQAGAEGGAGGHVVLGVRVLHSRHHVVAPNHAEQEADPVRHRVQDLLEHEVPVVGQQAAVGLVLQPLAQGVDGLVGQPVAVHVQLLQRRVLQHHVPQHLRPLAAKVVPREVEGAHSPVDVQRRTDLCQALLVQPCLRKVEVLYGGVLAQDEAQDTGIGVPVAATRGLEGCGASTTQAQLRDVLVAVQDVMEGQEAALAERGGGLQHVPLGLQGHHHGRVHRRVKLLAVLNVPVSIIHFFWCVV
eukprot:CAMPEP_0113935022 /NCGR_PEP_ID=MMETSP1339-20121228/2254_1 /TAXON_ID=94617 /ORGANISM="Fibrocapsa japonica" /LENGTH=381 /DNA_ID=CAMNT_0000937035 /DNA_START=191 /DNA_END=1333 /DNA_ORIENTATION=+ /assembly_acc=CAM_ASM_000762